MSNSPVTTPKHKKTSSLDIGNSSGRVSRSGGSAHSSGRKSLFNKILRRRSDLIPESIGSSSTKVSQGSIDSPLAQKTNSGDRNGSVSRKSSKNRRSKRFSLGSSSSIIADDNSSVYDYHEGDTREGSIHSDILSSQTSSISDESLDAAIRYSTNFENHDYNEKLTFPTVDAPESELVDDEPIWSGLTFESLVTPKYTKAARKNKHAPRIVNNLFLAQELNTENLSFDHEVQSSDEEADLENNENETGGSDAKASKTHLGYPGIDEEHNEKSDPNKNTQAEIYVMEFSRDGKYLAAAGKDSTIKIWKVILSPLSRLESKNVEQDGGSTAKSSNARDKLFTSAPVFHQEPMCVFEGHTNSILSLDWSKNNFLITGSMDRTAKLWHVDRPNCLQTFQHEDFVTGVKFHPTDDRFFLSGSLDNEVRLWSVLENNVAFSKNIGDDVLVTALSFTPDGSHCLVGGFNGTITLLETRGLHFIYKYEVKEKSIVHPFINKNGNKITGIKVFENEAVSTMSLKNDLFEKWNVLITTNDSKVRLVNSSLKKLVTRFKGLSNNSSSIVASMSDDHHYIISGSEDHWCYIWENNNYIINNKLRLALKDLVLEGKHHINDLNKKHKIYNKIIKRNKLLKKLNFQQFLEDDASAYEYVSNENSSYTTFHAHHSKVNVALFAPESTKRLLEFSDDIIFDLVKRGRKFGLDEPKGTVDGTTTDSTLSLQPFQDNALGHIIVSADQRGIIRIFRQDAAHEVRKKLIDMQKHNKSYNRSSRSNCRPNSQSNGSLALESRISRTKGSNLKLDLSNINKKMQNRSLSPGTEIQSSFKDKLHSKFKNNQNGLKSSRSRNNTVNDYSSRSSSASPVAPRSNLTLSLPIIPKVVSSSSLINTKHYNAHNVSGGVFENSGLNVQVTSDSDETHSQSEKSNLEEQASSSNTLTGSNNTETPPSTAPASAVRGNHRPSSSDLSPVLPHFDHLSRRNKERKVPLIINTETDSLPDDPNKSEVINFETPIGKPRFKNDFSPSIDNAKFKPLRSRRKL